MQQIAKVQTQDRTVNQLQDNISNAVAPVIARAPNNSSLLTNQALQSGNNTINHGLNRKLQGWSVIRWHGGWAQVYDLQDTNGNQSQTLVLNSSAAVTVDLEVF